MNWIIRIGEWWESRRVLRKPDLLTIQLSMKAQADVTLTLFKRFGEDLLKLEKKIVELERNLEKSIGA